MDMIVFVVAAIVSYWYETEIFLFFGGAFIMVRFLIRWYKPVQNIWPPSRGRTGRLVLGVLPLVAAAIILAVLVTAASFDVVGIWIFFYIVMGFAWIAGGAFLVEHCLDLFWANDAVYLDNKAVIFPAAGAFLGLTLVYAGANIGDGPGWWVVLLAGGLGFAAWIGLAVIVNLVSRFSERITVDRDTGSGIRFGMYLVASGLILARASGGTWTGAEALLPGAFAVGWPVFLLAALTVIVEQFYLHRSPRDTNEKGPVIGSVIWGCVYLASAVSVWVMFPFQ